MIIKKARNTLLWIYQGIRNRLVRIYQGIRYQFLRVTGMMGYEERLNLYHLVQSSSIDKGVVIEFGAFFGASTAAIQAGIQKKNSASGLAEFYVVDSFLSRTSSCFTDHVRMHAKHQGAESLLKEENGFVDFYDCFLENVGKPENMHIVRHLLSDFTFVDKPISFMHLDLPKEWSQLEIIITACFPYLGEDSMVLFQDFGYQWSAELIAAIGLMLKNGNISVINLVDATLSVKVERKFSEQDIGELIRAMSNDEEIIAGIGYSKDFVRPFFSTESRATVQIALAQFYFSIGRVATAFEILSAVLLDCAGNIVIASKVSEVLGEKFMLDTSYE